jgi:transcriptional regulator of the spore photoproduct lyase operon
MTINQTNSYKAGDTVFIFYRNPHTQDVANIQEAVVVNNPEHSDKLSLYLYETYYPLTNETAVYLNEEEAKRAYEQYFG